MTLQDKNEIARLGGIIAQKDDAIAQLQGRIKQEEKVPRKKSSKIPIRNLWFLMLYAYDLIHTLDDNTRVAVENNPDELPDLIATILANAVEKRLRQNLTVNLERQHADLSRVRGRINHIRTARKLLLQRGKIACSFDVFTTDTPKNQLVKAALNRLSPLVKTDKLKERCYANASALERSGVVTEYVHRDKVKAHRIVSSSRSIPEDRLMLEAAKLALDLELPTQQEGDMNWIAPNRDKIDMPKLFEKAVFNFYKIKLRKWNVQRRTLKWDFKECNEQMKDMLPEMKTDITLERHTSTGYKRIIIDTKFTNIIQANQQGKEKFKSQYMYQIYAYLRAQKKDGDRESVDSTGILLHPSLGTDIDASGIIQGHSIRFLTVNLDADTKTIINDLCKIIPN